MRTEGHNLEHIYIYLERERKRERVIEEETTRQKEERKIEI